MPLSPIACGDDDASSGAGDSAALLDDDLDSGGAAGTLSGASATHGQAEPAGVLDESNKAPPPGPEAVDVILTELHAIAAQSAASKVASEGSDAVCGGDGEKSGCLGEGGDPTFVAKWDVAEHTVLDDGHATLRLTVSNALPIPWTVKGRARLELSGEWHDTEWFTATLEPSTTTTLEIDLTTPVAMLGLGESKGLALVEKLAAPGVVYVSLDANTALPAALLRPSPTGDPWTVEALAELEANGELGESTPLQEYIPVPNLRVSTDGTHLDVFSDDEAARLLLEAPVEDATKAGYDAATVDRHRAIANDPVLKEMLGSDRLPVMVVQWTPPAPALDGTTAIDEENGKPRTDLTDPNGVEETPSTETDEEVLP